MICKKCSVRAPHRSYAWTDLPQYSQPAHSSRNNTNGSARDHPCLTAQEMAHCRSHSCKRQIRTRLSCKRHGLSARPFETSTIGSFAR